MFKKILSKDKVNDPDFDMPRWKLTLQGAGFLLLGAAFFYTISFTRIGAYAGNPWQLITTGLAAQTSSTEYATLEKFTSLGCASGPSAPHVVGTACIPDSAPPQLLKFKTSDGVSRTDKVNFYGNWQGGQRLRVFKGNDGVYHYKLSVIDSVRSLLRNVAFDFSVLFILVGLSYFCTLLGYSKLYWVFSGAAALVFAGTIFSGYILERRGGNIIATMLFITIAVCIVALVYWFHFRVKSPKPKLTKQA